MEKTSDNNRCFVCGKENDRGLHLEFTYNKKTKEAESNIIFPAYYQGWEEIVHGGLVGTVLDEIQVKAASFNNYRCLTAELNVKYKKPVKTESTYFLTGKIIKVTKRIIYTKAFLKDEDLKIVTIAKAKLFIV